MIYLFRLQAIVFHLFLSTDGAAQRPQPTPVQWRFELSSANMNEAILHVEARIAPGWHIYSQNLQPGGPLPTRLTFGKQNGYLVMGPTNEQGTAVRYYDKLYDMDIIWYADKVSFTQTIMINQPNTSISGTVEYMVCNEHVCIPAEEKFSVFSE
jgi:DsbC/DsbD-like thiol-disulfide interchange protein